jgi:hypothetical protein
MKIGDTIVSDSERLLTGMPAGYNGTDFDLLRSQADNTDAVNPVTGGQAGAPLRTFAELVGYNGASFDRIRSCPDNQDNTAVATLGILRVLAEQGLFNGTSFDRARGNLDNVSLAALVGAVASGNSADQTNFNGRGVKVVIDITAIAAGTITVTIKGKDPVSGKYFNMLASTALNATGTTVLTIYPALPASANVSANDVLPRTWRVEYTIAGATVTATIGAIVLV